MEFVAGSFIITSATLLALAVARGLLEILFYAINRPPRVATDRTAYPAA